jgi:hypothetical protein
MCHRLASPSFRLRVSAHEADGIEEPRHVLFNVLMLGQTCSIPGSGKYNAAKREDLSTFSEVSHQQQGSPHEAMPDHQRDCRPLSLGQRQEIGSEVATGIAVERQ